MRRSFFLQGNYQIEIENATGQQFSVNYHVESGDRILNGQLYERIRPAAGLKSGYTVEFIGFSFSPRIAGGTPLCLTAFSIGAIENPELLRESLKFIGFVERSLCFI